MYIYIYIFMHIYIHIYIHVFMNVYIHAGGLLHPVDQAVILALCLDVENNNPLDGLTYEEMFPYVQRILDLAQNWMIHSTGIFVDIFFFYFYIYIYIYIYIYRHICIYMCIYLFWLRIG
jgi:hypothetical protein